MILAEPLIRIPNSPDQPRLKIRASAREIQNLVCVGIEKQRIDAEVPAKRVLSRIRFEPNAAWTTTVLIAEVTAKRCDFHMRFAVVHQDNPEVRAHLPGMRKQPEQFIRTSRCRDIEILRYATEQQVPHAAADQPGGMPGTAQTTDDD